MSTLITVITAIVQVVAVAAAAWSLRMVHKQHRYRILMDLHKELLEVEMQKSISVVCSMEPERLVSPTDAETSNIERVLAVYDLIGLRAKQEAIELDDLLASEWRVLLPLSAKVQPFIDKQRKLRDCKSYKEFFLWLVAQADDYRNRLHPGEEPKPFAKGDLVRREGCSMIFINDAREVLLYQRDDDPSLEAPGKWDLFGGHIESGEVADQAMAREIKEELDVYDNAGAGICSKNFREFRKYTFFERDEYVYWSILNHPTSILMIKEGRDPRWFSQSAIEDLDIAFGFKDVLRDFFRSLPQMNKTA